MRTLRIFFAGKVDPLSPHAAPFWRSEAVWQLNRSLQHYHVMDSSLVHQRDQMLIEKGLPTSVLFTQSCFYIRHSDVFVVNLTDDISVGGSQEIFIAKQFGIPVIGIAPRGGKFNRLKYELGGKTYWNWLHPFVSGLCDLVVHDIEELASALDSFETIPSGGLGSIESAQRQRPGHHCQPHLGISRRKPSPPNKNSASTLPARWVRPAVSRRRVGVITSRRPFRAAAVFGRSIWISWKSVMTLSTKTTAS